MCRGQTVEENCHIDQENLTMKEKLEAFTSMRFQYQAWDKKMRVGYDVCFLLCEKHFGQVNYSDSSQLRAFGSLL